MRVETQVVRPDVVITLTHEEARHLRQFVGIGTADIHARLIPTANETWPLRHALYDALVAKGV